MVVFLFKLDWGVVVLGDFDVCCCVVYENVEDVFNVCIDYVELCFFFYYMVMKYSLFVIGVVEVVVDGVCVGVCDFGI